MQDTVPDKTNAKKPRPDRKLLLLEKSLFITAAGLLEFFAMLEYSKMEWIANPIILPFIAAPLIVAGILVRRKRKKSIVKQST